MMMIRSRVNNNNNLTSSSSSRIFTTPPIIDSDNNNRNDHDDNIIEDNDTFRREHKKKIVIFGCFDWLRQHLKRRQRRRKQTMMIIILCFVFCCCLINILRWNSRRLADDSTKGVSILIVPPGRENLKPVLHIIQGKSHRYDVNSVVFAMSKGYNTQIDMYYTLIGSLLTAGYDGDIVLGMDPINMWSIEIQNYLSTIENLIIYDVSKGCSKIKQQKQKQDMIIIEPPNQSNNNNTSNSNSNWDDIICTMDGYYQDPINGRVVKDTVVGKSLRKFRYEHYWIWSQQYSPQTSILIVDSRDTYFQLNPFHYVPLKSTTTTTTTNSNNNFFFLYFFEERPDNKLNTKETSKWIKKLYGQRFSLQFLSKYGNSITLCSGTTIGSRYLIAQYLILMIIELNNSIRPEYPSGDQAHHNVLFYDEKKLLKHKNLLRSDNSNNNNSIEVDIKSFHNYDGIVATIGGKPYNGLHLIEQKENNNNNGADETSSKSIVVDNNGKTIPIVHQFDRHPTLIVTNLIQVDQMRNKQNKKQGGGAQQT